MGRGVRPGSQDLAGLDVHSIAAFLAQPAVRDRLLVLGSTAELVAVAAAAPNTAIAFGGTGELFRLFALDPSPAAARHRLESGTSYPADLGVLALGTVSRQFLVGVGAGSLAGPGWRTPWGQRRRPVGVEGQRAIKATARGLVVMNAQHWGRWHLAPRAAINDARVEAQVFDGAMTALLRLRPALRHGLHERSRLVKRTTSDHFRVTIPVYWAVSCDGVAVGRGPFTVSLLPAAVTLLV